MERPCSHLSCQKRVFVPLPTLVVTAAKKKALTLSCTCILKHAQGLSGCVFWSHSHLIRNDQERISRL
uniref:Uncharacterized protein n=1 Tax=Arundo donax TaxID=35708 RepID=A0A0A9E2B4_ARUDO